MRARYRRRVHRCKRGLLWIAAGAVALFASCVPESAAVPCNADEDCAPSELCLRGVCTEGKALGPRPDGGTPVDASEPPSDAGSSADDGGSTEDDAGPVDGGDGGSDGGVPGDDGGDSLTDSGPDPILDAGPPGIVSFTASPSVVSFGGTVTLTWETRGLSSCALEGSDESIETNGSLVVERPASRPYLLRCTDEHDEVYEEEVAVVVGCPSTVTLGALTIASDDDLVLFPTGSCVDVTGSVEVTGISHTSLVALYGLRTVGGGLSLGDNPNLARLDGLELLSEVGGDLRLGFRPDGVGPLRPLPALTSVHGLSALQTIGVDLEIYEASLLPSLAGLERLTEVGDDFDVRDSPLLEGFGALRRLVRIGGLLELSDNLALHTLGLPALESIGRGVRLDDLPALTDVQALSRVEGSLHIIYVRRCDSLTSLAGLEGVSELKEYLHVQLNSSLRDLEGLSGLERAERVVIRHNDALVSANLPALEIVDYSGSSTCSGSYCDGDLIIEHNPRLEQLDDFQSLGFVRRDLRIVQNDSLRDVTGFPRLTRVYNDLVVWGNKSLGNLVGFESLSLVDDLDLFENPELTRVELPALERVIDDVRIVDNDGLTSLDGVQRLSRIGGDLIIERNDRLVDLGSAPLEHVGDYPECVAGCLFHIRENPNLPMSDVWALLEVLGRPAGPGDEENLDVSGNGG